MSEVIIFGGDGYRAVDLRRSNDSLTNLSCCIVGAAVPSQSLRKAPTYKFER